jgi:hypothetical protein
MPDSDDNRPVAGRAVVYENSAGEIFIKTQSSLPGDHPYYALIGRVASEWTHFEHILDEIIRDISQIHENVALCITRQKMGATPRFKAIEALTKYVGLPESLLKKTRGLKPTTTQWLSKETASFTIRGFLSETATLVTRV